MNTNPVRFQAIKFFNPPTKELPVATGIMTYDCIEDIKIGAVEKEIPFRAYYPSPEGYFHIDLPEGNGFSVSDDHNSCGGRWNFTWSATDPVFEDMHDIKRRFDGVLRGKPRICEDKLPALDTVA